MCYAMCYAVEKLTESTVGVQFPFIQGEVGNAKPFTCKTKCTMCRRNKSLPKFNLFLHKVEAKQETEKLIASKNKKLQDFWKRWEPLS